MSNDTNYTPKLQAQKASLEKMKEARSKAEATQEQLVKQKDQLEGEVRGLGVEPEELETKTRELDAAIKADIAQVDELIPERFKVGVR